MNANYLVYFLVIADIVIGIAYGVKGDWWRLVYWLCAGVLSTSTIFIK